MSQVGTPDAVIEYSHEGDMVMVRLAGATDESSTDRLDAVIRYVHEAMPCYVTVDVSALHHAGLAAGFLTALRESVTEAGRQFVTSPARYPLAS